MSAVIGVIVALALFAPRDGSCRSRKTQSLAASPHMFRSELDLAQEDLPHPAGGDLRRPHRLARPRQDAGAVGLAINLFASEQASPELKQAMHVETTEAVTRPLVEFDQLRWQRVKHADGTTSQRINGGGRIPERDAAETARGVEIVQERESSGHRPRVHSALDEGSFLYMPHCCASRPRFGAGKCPAGHGDRQRA
jgi:hypothetical protein